MTATSETPRDVRKKLRRAETSRDSWKTKLYEKQYEIRKLKSLLSAVRANRDEWRDRCRECEEKMVELEHTLVCVQQRPEEGKTATAQKKRLPET